MHSILIQFICIEEEEEDLVCGTRDKGSPPQSGLIAKVYEGINTLFLWI